MGLMFINILKIKQRFNWLLGIFCHQNIETADCIRTSHCHIMINDAQLQLTAKHFMFLLAIDIYIYIFKYYY